MVFLLRFYATKVAVASVCSQPPSPTWQGGTLERASVRVLKIENASLKNLPQVFRLQPPQDGLRRLGKNGKITSHEQALQTLRHIFVCTSILVMHQHMLKALQGAARLEPGLCSTQAALASAAH